MNTVHLLISGLVQGVGFRHFVRAKANELGLVGWVKNTENPSTGSGQAVEVLVQGPKEQLEKLIEYCRKGPMLSEVKDVSIDWQESPPVGGTEFSSFEIK